MTPGFIFLMDGGQDGSQWFFLLEAYAALGSGKRTGSNGGVLVEPKCGFHDHDRDNGGFIWGVGGEV